MKSFVIAVMLVSLFAACKIRYTKSDTVLDKKEVTPNFANQGEQEVYWTKKLFESKYKKQNFKKYNGNIKLDDNHDVMYGDTVVQISGCDGDLKSIFTSGLLYPQIWGENKIRIGNVEELHFLNQSPKNKRFTFLMWHPQMHNPTVCFFELTNDKASKKTNIAQFIKGSKLTFFQSGWIQI